MPGKQPDHQHVQREAPWGRLPIHRVFDAALRVRKPVIIAVAAVGLLLFYQIGLLSAVGRWIGISARSEPLPSAFQRISPDEFLTTSNALGGVGRSPVDPSRVAFPAFERSVVPDIGDKTRSCPPGLGGFPAAEAGASHEPPARSAATAAPKPVETPVISPPEPVAGPGEAQGKKLSPDAVPAESEEPPKAGTPPGEAAPDGEFTGGSVTGKSRKGPRSGPVAKPALPVTAPKKSLEPEEPAKSEQFQLPGSFVVKIPNYTGSPRKWGLMVILDNSAAMGRKIKSWDSSRSQVATTIVTRLMKMLPPGSKVAVRDFSCKKSTGAPKPCLSRVLIEWSLPPIKQLKEKLESVEATGATNPCAAAAYAIKRDLAGLEGLMPRVLIVTPAVAKCDQRIIAAALRHGGEKGAPAVDVIALGMSGKRERGYSGMVKKGKGVLVKVDKPADLDDALKKYEKVLQKKALERLEVRGEKATFTPEINEEITLAPGTYTVTLPVIAGILPAKRSVPNIKISSGESKVVVVRAKQGRVTIKSGKKQ